MKTTAALVLISAFTAQAFAPGFRPTAPSTSFSSKGLLATKADEATATATETAFENAIKIVAAIDGTTPFDEFAELVVDDAPFVCQCDALKEVTTVKGYADWMYGFGTGIAPGAKATVHSTAWDAETKTAHYFATYTAKHTGEAGPCPPTDQETNSDYFCAVKMNDEGKCIKLTKVWNDGFALKELGWC